MPINKILILNGPNLKHIGKREPDIYGSTPIVPYLESLQALFPFTIECCYTNSEGEIIDRIESTEADGIVLNAGGYTHTSVAIADAIRATVVPVIEVHISNIYARESFRRQSLIAPFCKGSVSGFGLDGYRLALIGLEQIIANQAK